MSDEQHPGGRRSWDLDRGEIVSALNDMRDTITELRIEVGKLTVKAGIWGALAGAATAAIPLTGLLVALLRSGKL